MQNRPKPSLGNQDQGLYTKVFFFFFFFYLAVSIQAMGKSLSKG